MEEDGLCALDEGRSGLAVQPSLGSPQMVLKIMLQIQSGSVPCLIHCLAMQTFVLWELGAQEMERRMEGDRVSTAVQTAL